MTSEEKMRILEMIQEGKITAEEGSRLLDAVEEEKIEQIPSSKTGRTVKIKVTDKNSGTVKVNLKIPLGIARFFKNLIPPSERMKIETHGFDLDALFTELENGRPGKIIEVDNEEDDHRVEIGIE